MLTLLVGGRRRLAPFSAGAWAALFQVATAVNFSVTPRGLRPLNSATGLGFIKPAVAEQQRSCLMDGLAVPVSPDIRQLFFFLCWE